MIAKLHENNEIKQIIQEILGKEKQKTKSSPEKYVSL